MIIKLPLVPINFITTKTLMVTHIKYELIYILFKITRRKTKEIRKNLLVVKYVFTLKPKMLTLPIGKTQ